MKINIFQLPIHYWVISETNLIHIQSSHHCIIQKHSCWDCPLLCFPLVAQEVVFWLDLHVYCKKEVMKHIYWVLKYAGFNSKYLWFWLELYIDTDELMITKHWNRTSEDGPAVCPSLSHPWGCGFESCPRRLGLENYCIMTKKKTGIGMKSIKIVL